jgi:hypothetical protein
MRAGRIDTTRASPTALRQTRARGALTAGTIRAELAGCSKRSIEQVGELACITM